MIDENLSREKERVKTILNSYLIDKKHAEIKALEIEEVKNNYDITGMTFGEKTGQTFKINKEVENRVVNKPDKIKELEQAKRFYEINCEKVEKAVEILKEFEKDVIVLKYMTSPVMQWRDISRKLGFTVSACQRAEDRAIKKIIKKKMLTEAFKQCI